MIILSTLLEWSAAQIHKEAKMPILEYCKYFEYPIEQHPIITEDGYILTYFRIQKKGSKIVAGKKPILLHHGLLDSSDTWVINDESKAPAFMLANLDYDVWLGNSRGNKHSRNHTHMNPDKDKTFWQFTFQDMAEQDLPAAFKYIRAVTNQKLHYVGHSQGTIIMHIALSERNPVVEENLDQYFGFGPVVWVNNSKSNVMNLAAHSAFEQLVKDFRIHQFLPSAGWLQTDVGVAFCGLFGYVCADLLKYVMDADPSQDNYQRYDVLVGHDPSGTSSQNMFHWKQMLITGEFKKYDYGATENLKRYGQRTPPLWNLTNIRRPLNLFAGDEDLLADPVDVAHLWRELDPSFRKFLKTYPAGHCTFMWGKTVQPWMSDLTNMLKQGVEQQ